MRPQSRRYPVDDSIFFRRHSFRSFLDREIPPDVLDRIIEKTRWSPSSANNQPWRFVFVRDPQRHAAAVEALSRGNGWAAAAPILIAACAREADDAVRQDDPVRYYQFDTGLATMSLLLAAVDEGLMAHPMAGYDAPKMHAALDIPAEYHIICMIALGYEGPTEQLDERTRAKDSQPRVRKPVEEIISWDCFACPHQPKERKHDDR